MKNYEQVDNIQRRFKNLCNDFCRMIYDMGYNQGRTDAVNIEIENECVTCKHNNSEYCIDCIDYSMYMPIKKNKNCDGCKYENNNFTEMPCYECRYSYEDKYE